MKNRDDDRRAILARRARFIAAAVTAAGLVGAQACAREAKPEPCLEPMHVDHEIIVPEVDGAAGELDDDDAALPGRADAGAEVEQPIVDEGPPPQPCLSF